MDYSCNKLKLACVSALLALSSQTQAASINFDLTNVANADRYNVGAGVFGTTTSKWNEYSRTASANNLALTDDTGAATSVTVSYTRYGSGSAVPSGAFSALGGSSVSTGSVTLSGLVANGNYDLAIFSGWSGAPSFSVNGVIKTLNRSSNWSTLAEGVQYLLFHTVADAAGHLTFTANANPTAGTLTTNSAWSAFQLQSSVSSVPVPASLGMFSVAVAGLGFVRRKTKKT